MEISVYLKDYVEKLKKDKMKPFYNKKNNNFEIDNIYDYLKIIDILQNEKEKDRNAVFKEFYYRGVSNSEWELLPSLAVNDLEFYEPVMIEEFKKAYPSEFDVKDDFEIIAKMQHYGLPTRLLDFTSNPLVSLYFSCSDIQQKEKDGKVIVALPRKNLYDGLDEYRDLIYKAHDQSFLLSWLEENPGNLYTYLGMVYVPNSLFFKTPSYITEREKRQSSVFMLFAKRTVMCAINVETTSESVQKTESAWWQMLGRSSRGSNIWRTRIRWNSRNMRRSLRQSGKRPDFTRQ